MSIHPQIIEKDGKKEFVVLPYEEFLRVQEALEDYDDLRTLRDEKVSAADEPTRAHGHGRLTILSKSSDFHSSSDGRTLTRSTAQIVRISIPPPRMHDRP